MSSEDASRQVQGNRFYIRTFTGDRFYWDNIETNTFNINDIAHALSCNCRWTGHVKRFYSVAQHSVLCSTLVPPEDALAALLHDAAEAYVHDTPSPLKNWLKQNGFTTFKDLETRIAAALFSSFGLSYPYSPAVKAADVRLLATEGRDLMNASEDWSRYGEPYEWQIGRCWLPSEAENLFLDRFKEITHDKG